MQNSDVVRALLVMEAWSEGRKFGGATASEAIAWCLANRVRSGMSDWMSVLRDADKYKQGVPAEWDYPNMWDAGFITLSQNINDIYDNRGRDISCGGLFYAKSDEPMSDWFKDNIVKNPTLGITMQSSGLIIYGGRGLPADDPMAAMQPKKFGASW
jgi:hypothetical protein